MIRIILINIVAALFLCGGIAGILESDSRSRQIGLLRLPVAYLLCFHARQLAKRRSGDWLNNDD
jgi:hypothetical protein